MSAHYAAASVLGLSIGAGSYTATRAKVSMPVRLWVSDRKGKAWGWLFDLVSCPYCFAHWLAFGAALIWRPWVISGFVIGQFLVTSLAMVAVASPVILVIRKLAG